MVELLQIWPRQREDPPQTIVIWWVCGTLMMIMIMNWWYVDVPTSLLSSGLDHSPRADQRCDPSIWICVGVVWVWPSRLSSLVYYSFIVWALLFSSSRIAYTVTDSIFLFLPLNAFILTILSSSLQLGKIKNKNKYYYFFLSGNTITNSIW